MTRKEAVTEGSEKPKRNRIKTEVDFQPISPAEGEARETIIKYVEDLLKTPGFDVTSFDAFILRMIHLLGGVEDRLSGNMSTRESDLLDPSKQASIKFGISPKGGNDIRVTSPKGHQLFWYGVSSLTDRKAEIMSWAYVPAPEKITIEYDSYLTSNRRSIVSEPIIRTHERIALLDEEAQMVCARIFEVYERSAAQ